MVGICLRSPREVHYGQAVQFPTAGAPAYPSKEKTRRVGVRWWWGSACRHPREVHTTRPCVRSPSETSLRTSRGSPKLPRYVMTLTISSRASLSARCHSQCIFIYKLCSALWRFAFFLQRILNSQLKEEKRLQKNLSNIKKSFYSVWQKYRYSIVISLIISKEVKFFVLFLRSH